MQEHAQRTGEEEPGAPDAGTQGAGHETSSRAPSDSGHAPTVARPSSARCAALD